jgi:hypothetical protein
MLTMSSVERMGFVSQRQAATDIDYNLEYPPLVYNNATIHSCLSSYSDMAREVYGPGFDLINSPIVRVCLMRSGGAKKHGRYVVADSILQEVDIPTLPQIRARSSSTNPSICPRPTIHRIQM